MASVDYSDKSDAAPAASPSRDERQHHPPSQRSSASQLPPPIDLRGLSFSEEDDDSLDPAAFLKSVRELSEKREREDNERYRKLEEDIEKGRQERLARREERAKSISSQRQEPSKFRPQSRTQTSSERRPATPTTPKSSDRTPTESTRATPTMADNVPEFKGFGSIKRPSAASPSTPSSTTAAMGTPDPASRQSPSAAMPGRSGTVKWQQRPTSRGTGSRPLSMLATENRVQAKSTPADEPEPSRDQISAALGARDPSWFRQTADRGTGNAAFRKSKDEMGGTDTIATGRRGLPGMSRGDSSEPSRDMSPTSESVVSETTSKFDSGRDSSAWSSRFSTNTSISEQSRQGAEPVKTAPSVSNHSSVTDGERPSLGRGLSMSSSQARLAEANDRPSSPTKGMGGFVQSAMMKRSDSMNKRWSAQPAGGSSLSRQNSTASARSGFGGLQGSYSMPKLEPVGDSSRESSHEPSSRPSSSSSNLTHLAQNTESQRDAGSFTRPGLAHSRSKSIASAYSTSASMENTNGPMSPPASPNKRWSPNKSSWIESALAKPDSPKLSPTKEKAQPSWMGNIARAKAQRESADMTPKASPAPSTPDLPTDTPAGRPRSPTKSTPFGPALLKRSDSRDLRLGQQGVEAEIKRSITPPTKAKPAGLSSRPTSTLAQESLEMGERMGKPTTREETLGFKKEASPTEPVLDKSSSTDEPAPLFAKKSAPTTTPSVKPDITSPKPEPPSPASQPELAKSPPPSATKSRFDAPPTKPEPLSTSKPQTDFRSTLRSRAAPPPKEKGEPEFLSKFGALKKAQTQNYVAPDPLKDNILRGKSGLVDRGGPQKREKKDELRDSLLAKKEQWKQDKEAGIVHERQGSLGKPEAPSKPEALARREVLSRGGSVKKDEERSAREETPEALRRGKSLRNKENPVEVQVEAPKPLQLRTEKRVPSPSVAEEKPAQLLEAKSFSPAPLSLKSRGAPKAELVYTPAEKKPLPSPSVEKPPSPSPPVQEKGISQPEKRVVSPPAAAAATATETSKMAARFNPGLANILARGPPAAGASPSGSRAESPAGVKSPPITSPSEPPAEDGQLQDMRKGRAKGPKKRKGGATIPQVDGPALAALENKAETVKPVVASDFHMKTEAPLRSPSPATPASRPMPTRSPSGRFPIAGVGGPRSAASVMAASLGSKEPGTAPGRAATFPRTSTPDSSKVEAPLPSSSPSTPGKSSTPIKRSPSASQAVPESRPAASRKDDIPEFRGFGSSSMRGKSASTPLDENKENSNSALPSVKNAASMWGRPSGLSVRSSEKPSQVQLPTKKDEEAAMRSAGLLANSPARSPSRPGSSNSMGMGLQGLRSPGSPAASVPPKPAKSSRIVSGQLTEASSNKGPSSPASLEPETEAECLLVAAFGSWPKSSVKLSIDTTSVITKCKQVPERRRTLRKSVEELAADGSTKQLPPREDYTLFDGEVYICAQTYMNGNGAKATQVYTWAGTHAVAAIAEAASAAARATAKREGSTLAVQPITQGHEPADFLEAVGGILITRRGSRQGAAKQFMLCGRKHLGHIVFDEVDFSPASLKPAFAILISHPVTLQQTKLFLWKGTACSAEETSAGKLAAMDISDTGELIEVSGGAEFSSFLRLFPPGTTKASLPKPSSLSEQKARYPEKFTTRLFRIRHLEERASLFTAVFSRRPSWGARSPAPEQQDVKAEVKELSPFTQMDLDPEGLYLLDAYGDLHVFVGPLFASTQPDHVRNGVLAQALLFAGDYAILVAGMEDRPRVPEGKVVFSGMPRDLKDLFRFWDEGRGVWGTAGLMAGSASVGGKGVVSVVGLDEVARAVCERV